MVVSAIFLGALIGWTAKELQETIHENRDKFDIGKMLDEKINSLIPDVKNASYYNESPEKQANSWARALAKNAPQEYYFNKYRIDKMLLKTAKAAKTGGLRHIKSKQQVSSFVA